MSAIDAIRSRAASALVRLAGAAAPPRVSAPTASTGPSRFIDSNVALAQTPGRTSTDAAYRRHEFVTWQGWYEWAAGWSPKTVNDAVLMHLRGWPYMSASLARHVVKYPPIFGALKQRFAPSLRTTWRIDGPTTAPGRFAVEDLRRTWREQFRPDYADTLRTIALMGGQWIHVHWELDTRRGVEVPKLKRWPWEACMWRGASPSFPGGWYAMTMDSGLVRMTPGDGHWLYLAHSSRAHEMGAVLALGTTFVSGEMARRDEAGLSEAAGRAAPYAVLPKGVSVLDEIGQAVQAFVEDFGLARVGGVLPNGTDLKPFQIVSNTDFFANFTAEQLTFSALVILGQPNTLTPSAGSGVYQNLGGLSVSESLVDEDQEATVRGWQQLERAYCEINGQDFEDEMGEELIQLVGERYADRGAKAKAEAERATLHANTVAAQVAVFEVTQADADAQADRLSTPRLKLKAAPVKEDAVKEDEQVEEGPEPV